MCSKPKTPKITETPVPIAPAPAPPPEPIAMAPELPEAGRKKREDKKRGASALRIERSSNGIAPIAANGLRIPS